MLCNKCNKDLVNYIPSPNIKSVTCWRCVAAMVAPPEPPKPSVPKLSPEEKQARKDERAKQKTQQLEEKKAIVHKRGWHKKTLYEHDGQYFSLGKPITEAEAFKLKQQLKKQAQSNGNV